MWRINVSLGRSVQRFFSFLSLRDYLSKLGLITKLHVLHSIFLFVFFSLDLETAISLKCLSPLQDFIQVFFHMVDDMVDFLIAEH